MSKSLNTTGDTRPAATNQEVAEKKKIKRKPIRPKTAGKPLGYCVRTGEQIPFNVNRPVSYTTYKNWDKNPTNPENFCHYSGEPSHGETSVSNPVLKKNLRKAKAVHGF